MSNMQKIKKNKKGGKRLPQKGALKSKNGGRKLIEWAWKSIGDYSRTLFIFTSFRAFSGMWVFIFGPNGLSLM